MALFLSGWALMLLAMMLPTATTLLAAVGRLGHDRVAGRRLQLFAGAGFLSTWIFVGYAFRVGDLLVHSTVDSVDWLAARLTSWSPRRSSSAAPSSSLRSSTAASRPAARPRDSSTGTGTAATQVAMPCASAWRTGPRASAVAGRSCSSCSEWVLERRVDVRHRGCDGRREEHRDRPAGRRSGGRPAHRRGCRGCALRLVVVPRRIVQARRGQPSVVCGIGSPRHLVRTGAQDLIRGAGARVEARDGSGCGGCVLARASELLADCGACKSDIGDTVSAWECAPGEHRRRSTTRAERATGTTRAWTRHLRFVTTPDFDYGGRGPIH